MDTTQTSNMDRRKRFGEVQVGDHIRTVPADPGNGRLWSGVVKSVERRMSQALIGKPSEEMIHLVVTVEGRSLCADDLVYGFGAKKDFETGEVVSREVVYHLNYPVKQATFRKVRNRGRVRWDGMVITPEVAA